MEVAFQNPICVAVFFIFFVVACFVVFSPHMPLMFSGEKKNGKENHWV